MPGPPKTSTSPPANLVAERFDVDGQEFVAFSWDAAAGIPQLEHLSTAEREVCAMIVSGASNAEIARLRGTSARTVANQVAAIMKKLGAASRWEIMARFAGLAAR
jgi:DNA-binding NarL/FixJ family response regulator